jgi:GNAT superfamily N-acetyltransferase
MRNLPAVSRREPRAVEERLKAGSAIAAWSIRPATPQDAPFLPDIERSAGEAFRQVPDLAWIADDAVLSEERHLQLMEGGAAWVAVHAADVPVGFLSGEVLDGNLHIWELAVSSDHQQRGVGRALIARAKQWAAQRNLSAITLTTFREIPWNEPFYHSEGFRTLGSGELSQTLRGILADEVEAGLPAERRCAMRYELSGH